jgi:hypothetical protein
VTSTAGLPGAGRGGSGAARGWGQVFRVTRRNWPVMLRPLLLRTAVPALPAAVCVFVINEGIELGLPGGAGGLQVYGAFLLLVLCVPLAVAGGYLVASGLARAVAAASGPGIPGRHMSSSARRVAATPGEVRAGRLWAGYVAGLAVLMTISALAPVFISRATVTGHLTCAAIPGELNCATAPGLILCCAGPLGFVCSLMLLPATRRMTGGRSGFFPTASARLATAALAVMCYEIAVGYACLRLIITSPADSLFLPVTLAANLLTIPAMIFLVSATLVTNAEAATGLAGPASADGGG